MRIISPISRGSGAYIVHKLLASKIAGYEIRGFSHIAGHFPLLIERSLAKCIKGADLVHTLPDYGGALLSHTPSIITFHNYVLCGEIVKDYNPIQAFHKLFYLKNMVQKAVKEASKIVAVSRFTAQIAAKDLNIQNPIQVIYNGIDEKLFTPSPSSRSSKKREIVVLFSGNLTKRKGAHWLNDIAKKFNPRIRLIYTSGLRTKTKLPYQANMECAGNIRYEDMPDFYRSGDILLFPTVREGFGLCVAEAMACGLPVVASDCSSLPELIDHEKGGFLCKIGGIKDFAEKINLLAEIPSPRREMGEYNRAKAEKMFTLDKMVKEYKKAFEDVVDGN
ncbi:MAG: glycosyltransferase family 1 protein [Candidatus Dadabacteria bacterium]|nr:MAG: glycosyltransferase family 1 protein [Candidatus Dadabacteria bacterium]